MQMGGVLGVAALRHDKDMPVSVDYVDFRSVKP
jgi:hypothetical protein